MVYTALIALASTVVCHMLFTLTTRASPSASTKELYHSQSEVDRALWDIRYVSNFHALVATVGGVRAVLYDEGWQNDLKAAFASSDNSDRHLFLALTLGYLAYDLTLCVKFGHKYGHWTDILHHSVIIVAFSLGLAFDFGTFYMFCFCLDEFSTFFLNQNWWYQVAGIKSGRAFVTNLVLLFGSFFVIRVLFNSFVIFHMCRAWWRETCAGQCYDVIVGKLALHEQGVLLFVSTLSFAHYILNLFWFYKITRKLMRHIHSSKSSKSSKSS